jgi:AraC-like DNA-binding protein
MAIGGTTKFTDVTDYQTAVREAKFSLVFRFQKDFEAQLTQVELRYLGLFRGQENLPRVAHISLPADRAFVAFPARHNPPQIWDGAELQSGEIIFHARGQGGYQRTRGPSQWGIISLVQEYLASSVKALMGSDLEAPSDARILRPSRSDTAHLLSLHAKACRLAETRPELIARPEVARTLEQELLYAFVNCLKSNKAQKYSAPRRRHLKIISEFEKLLASHSARQLKIPEFCNLIGVSERTLRTCCAEFLGMSPNRYLRLRHLNMVRAALRCSDSKETVAELARRFGFWELGRFAGIYRSVYGETPSTTLRCARITRS